jgi:hypothetical protein
MVNKLKQAWKRDPIAVLGVGAITLAFLLWATPSPSFGISLIQYSCENGVSGGSAYSLIVVQVISGCLDNRYDQVIGAEGWFTLERLPAIVIFLALGALLFYVSVRRRGRAKRIVRSRGPQTLAVAIVSAAVSALVVTGAGLLFVNQVPSKTVFQNPYRGPTPTASLQFFPPYTLPPSPLPQPSPSPTRYGPLPTPEPTKAPTLSKIEQGAIADLLVRGRAYLEFFERWAWENPGYHWPYQIDALKSGFTESTIYITFSLTKRIPIVVSNANGYGLFKLKATCFFKRDPRVAGFGSDSWYAWKVAYDQYNGLAARYPFTPEKWIKTQTVKGGFKTQTGGWASDNSFWKEVDPCPFYQDSW